MPPITERPVELKRLVTSVSPLGSFTWQRLGSGHGWPMDRSAPPGAPAEKSKSSLPGEQMVDDGSTRTRDIEVPGFKTCKHAKLADIHIDVIACKNIRGTGGWGKHVRDDILKLARTGRQTYQT
jgi:hypothetical protein